MYDKRDGFDMVNFPFLDDDVTKRPSGVHISQIIRFARAPSHVSDFNSRNKILKANLDYKRLNWVPYLSFHLDIEVSTPLRAL